MMGEKMQICSRLCLLATSNKSNHLTPTLEKKEIEAPRQSYGEKDLKWCIID